MRFIKIAILIFVFSTNLMLGQKNNAPLTTEKMKVKKCFANLAESENERNKTVELRILQLQPVLIPSFDEDCLENFQANLLETGAFFRFSAF